MNAQWEAIRKEYFAQGIFALANGVTIEDLRSANEELAKQNVFAGCRGVEDAIEAWSNHPKDFNCKSVAYEQRS